MSGFCKRGKKQPCSTFVLVHGGFHGAWCWSILKPLLEKQGFKVITPDLSGRGKELYSYTDIIGSILEKQQQPVILLGHSSGGMVISELAKRYPDKIKGLVYLSAFLLPEGMSPPEVMKDDTISLMSSSLIVDEVEGTVKVKKDKAKELFFADCEESLARGAIENLVPEPIRPKADQRPHPPVPSTKSIRRFYIETLNDRALGITSQRRMQKLQPCEKVFTLTSGHSSFLSQPYRLAEILGVISRILDK